MSANSISWRRIKTLNRRMDERFVHATTSSTGEWWWWHCIRHNGSAVMVNTRTLETEPSDGATTTCSLLRDRGRNFPLAGDDEWLAELDKRATELDAPALASPS